MRCSDCSTHRAVMCSSFAVVLSSSSLLLLLLALHPCPGDAQDTGRVGGSGGGSGGFSSGGSSFQCPDELIGFFPHDTSCDKYWRCENRQATLLTCGNGLAFDDTDPNYERENCDYLHNVQCGQRSQIEAAISAPNCPRLYGIFADEVNCNTFWSCWAGEANRYQCPPGLAYDRSQRVCVWSDQVSECKAEELADGFKCPAEDNGIGTYSLYAHPDDCRLYYVCMNRSPREYGCPIGSVFKIGDIEGTGQCSAPDSVPGCEDYYGDIDLKSLKALGL